MNAVEFLGGSAHHPLAATRVAAGAAVAISLLVFTGAAASEALQASPSRSIVAPDDRSASVALTADAAAVVRWVVRTRDAPGPAFIVIDKKASALHVLQADGLLLASSPVLLGSARGDHTVPGIGDRPVAQVRPEERTTPAGRFIGELGYNMRGEDVVWVDYDAAVSIHRVLTTRASERRLERLQSPAPDDNRITYGCVNVPTNFFVTHLRPLYRQTQAVIYVLPESRPVAEVFGIDARDMK